MRLDLTGLAWLATLGLCDRRIRPSDCGLAGQWFHANRLVYLDALVQALYDRQPDHNTLIHHCDRGSQ